MAVTMLPPRTLVRRSTEHATGKSSPYRTKAILQWGNTAGMEDHCSGIVGEAGSQIHREMGLQYFYHPQLAERET